MIGISGGSGYIGSALARRFLFEGESVRILDFQEPPPDLKAAEFFKVDIRDKQGLLSAMKGCDVFYHMAAVVSKLRGFEDRRACVETNIVGTLNVLEGCLEQKTERLIYIGTSESLGDPLEVPSDENSSRFPKTTYGSTKATCEDLCREFFLLYNLNVVVPRLYMIYGPEDNRPMKYHNVIAKFIYSVMCDLSPLVYKDCIRTFLYITDCVKALWLLKSRGDAGEMYNICAPPTESISMYDLAMKIIKLCGGSMKPEIHEAPITDTKVKLPSGEKARRDFGFNPKIMLNEGLQETIEWGQSIWNRM